MTRPVTKHAKTFQLMTGTALLTLLGAASPAFAGSIDEVPKPMGWGYSYLLDISNNGIVVGTGEDLSSNYMPFVWDGSTLTTISPLAGGTTASASAISSDGTTIVGVTQNNIGGNEAFYYQGGVMTGIGYLGTGDYTIAQGVSADGSVIVGRGFNGTINSAFRWVGGVMTDLGTLGGSYSEALDVSADGSIVVGNSSNGWSYGFRWEAGNMVAIAGLSTFGSSASAISADGSTIVGNSYNGTITEAIKSVGGVTTGLGYLAGSSFDYSNAYDVSADGSIIVGESGYKGIVWQNGTMKTVNQILQSGGVNMAGTSVENAVAITDDGTYIVGGGTYMGSAANFIANITGGSSGVITPGELTQSLAGSTLPSVQSQSLVQGGLTQSLSTPMRYLHQIPSKFSPKNIQPAAGGDDALRLGYRRGFYATGSFGVGQNGDFSNREGAGTMGLLFMQNTSTVLGGGLIGGAARDKTHLNGHTSSKTKGISLMAAHNMADGWKIAATAALADIDIDSSRKYMNGGGVDTSNGKTDGYAYGVAARFGKELQYSETYSLMPYAQLDVTRTHLDAYTEQGGAFAASYTAHSHVAATARLGVESRKTLNDKTDLRGRVAWGHRLTGEDDVTATAALLTQTLTTNSGARDWIEGSVGASYRLNDATQLTADLDGHLSKNNLPAVNATVGMIWNF